MSFLEKIEKMSKKELVEYAKRFNIRGISKKTKTELKDLIMKYTKNKDKYIPKLLSKKQYEKIYHISDIHIRPLERHQEYRQVFKQLYNLIEPDNIIVITGDLLYEKDKLKPETYLIARELLKKLSEIGDVILITGNLRICFGSRVSGRTDEYLSSKNYQIQYVMLCIHHSDFFCVAF